MRLNRLRIDRLPGIDSPFRIETDGGGIHVIHGPNAIGKSSICRAVECLYWNDRGPKEKDRRCRRVRSRRDHLAGLARRTAPAVEEPGRRRDIPGAAGIPHPSLFLSAPEGSDRSLP